MGKTSLEGSNSSSKGGDSGLAAPLLAAGSVPAAAAATTAPAAATAAAAVAEARTTALAPADQDWSSSSSRPRTPQQRQLIEDGATRSDTDAAAVAAAAAFESSLMLLPISLTPAVALDPHEIAVSVGAPVTGVADALICSLCCSCCCCCCARAFAVGACAFVSEAQVQSIDLYANVKAYDHGQGCCAYLCSRCAPVFDWVSYLHAEAYQRPSSVSLDSRSDAAGTSSVATTAAGEEAEAQQPLQQQQQQQPRNNLALFVDVGQAPVGEHASLLTLFGNRQLVFRAVQEVNRAYSNFWRLLLFVLLLLVLFLPGIGLLSLLLLGCCSSLRKICDDAVLQQMRTACERADQRLATWGVGLLLLEGYPAAPVMPSQRQDLEMGLSLAAASRSRARNICPAPARSDAHAAAALAAISAAPSYNSRVWVLRVYMRPRRDGVHPAAAATTPAVVSAPPHSASSRLLSPSASLTAASAPGSSSPRAAAHPPAAAARGPAGSSQQAEENAIDKCCTQSEGDTTTALLVQEHDRKEAACGDGAIDVQQQQRVSSLRSVEEGAERFSTALRPATIAGDEIPSDNGTKVYAASGDATAETAATTETDSDEKEPPQSRASTPTIMQREADFTKKRKNGKSRAKQNGVREPLLCQEENTEVV